MHVYDIACVSLLCSFIYCYPRLFVLLSHSRRYTWVMISVYVFIPSAYAFSYAQRPVAIRIPFDTVAHICLSHVACYTATLIASPIMGV